MARRRRTKKLKLNIFREICSQLDIDVSEDYVSEGSSCVTSKGLEIVLEKLSLKTGTPPLGLSEEKETIWRLLHKSQDSFILSLEMINKITIPFRIESFTFLFINAWELLLKAKMLEDEKDIKDKDNPEYTKGFSKCARIVFGDKVPEYDNLIHIEEIRNDATHLFINIIPPSIMFVFQAGVKNYHEKLLEWFNIDITKRIPEGMLFLILDIDPSKCSPKVLKKKLSTKSFEYLEKWNNKIYNKIEGLEEKEIGKFFQPIKIDLAYVTNPKKADSVLYLGDAGPHVTKAVHVKDMDVAFPFFTGELIDEFSKKGIRVTPYDISTIWDKLLGIRSNKKYCYISPKHRRPQYSYALFNWIIGEIEKDNEFIANTRKRYRNEKNLR